MKKITEVTRRDITEIFLRENLPWYGRLGEIEFLGRLYNLEEMPSDDSRFDNAEQDIWQHRINNNDWEDDWIFYDKRFQLCHGNDDDFLLHFLCESIHPIVRSKIEETQFLLESYNKLIAPDGYKIAEDTQISGRPVFGFCEIDPFNPIPYHIMDIPPVPIPVPRRHSRVPNKPMQKILFGSPGTGKSHNIQIIANQKLNIPLDQATNRLINTVKTVFHPEYTYADFMGKLLPLTQNNSVIYKFYPGHFIRALGMAYRGLIEGKQDHYLLIIDEMNRGNAAAIFGTVLQLLDRESDGWSSYDVDISEMELVGLLEAMELKPVLQDGIIEIKEDSVKIPCQDFCQRRAEELNGKLNSDGVRAFNLLRQCRISIPQNLSIIATINTSDESIYYLDSAFKRRWDWQYFKAPVGSFSRLDVPEALWNTKLVIDDQEQELWSHYIVGINELIKANSHVLRRIEDKQIGWWFIKPENERVELEQVKDKLMFYLWDSVFARDKRPLEQFLCRDEDNEPIHLALYSDFITSTKKFMSKIYELGSKQYDISFDGIDF